MGGRWRHVGRARSEHARWRVAGALAAPGQTLLSEAVRSRCPHRLEPRFLRLQLAAATDLQALRRRLLRHTENGLERHQSAPLQAYLVGVARRQQSADLLPS